MIKIPFYSNKKLKLAFEMGVILSETASGMGKELTPEIVEKAEKILIGEFSTKSPTEISTEMQVLVLAAFETN